MENQFEKKTPFKFVFQSRLDENSYLVLRMEITFANKCLEHSGKYT